MLYKLGARPVQNVIRQSLATPFRTFAKKNDNGNDHLDPEYIQKTNDDFENSLSARQKAYYRADRLALLDYKKEQLVDETSWWNKLATMDADEMELMPYGFIKKYGTFMLKIREQ